MVTRPYIEQIDHKIDELEQQLNDLHAAKRVFAMLNVERGGKAAPLMIDHQVTTSKPKHKGRRPRMQGQLMEQIREVLAKHGVPIPSSLIINDLINEYQFNAPKQRVWAALSKMKKDGNVGFDNESGDYSLVKEQQS